MGGVKPLLRNGKIKERESGENSCQIDAGVHQKLSYQKRQSICFGVWFAVMQGLFVKSTLVKLL